MTEEGKENVRRWADFLIKTGIMVLLGIATYHLKKIDSELYSMRNTTERHEYEIKVLQTKESQNYRWIERIEAKLDKILEKVK